METDLGFIQQKEGVTGEENYPYQVEDGTCDATKVQPQNTSFMYHSNE